MASDYVWDNSDDSLPGYDGSSSSNSPTPARSAAVDKSPLVNRKSYKPPATQRFMDREQYKQCLSNCDLYIGIDQSDSMKCLLPGGLSRWQQLRMAVSRFAPYVTGVDPDGIDIFFITNDAQTITNCRTAQDVETKLDRVMPDGDTPTGFTLWTQLKPYLDVLRLKKEIQKKETTLWGKITSLRLKWKLKKHPASTKPRNYIFITDGEARKLILVHCDKDLLLYTILDAAQTLQDLDVATFTCSACKETHRQLGIQFVQIGDDPNARRFLEELDTIHGRGKSNLALQDIVDTTPADATGTLSSEALTKAILGGFTSHLDKRNEIDLPRSAWNFAAHSKQGVHSCPLGTAEFPGSGPGCWYQDKTNHYWKRMPECLLSAQRM
ncbi:hypothetical protein C8R43DRAFT_1120792 [Mycena crocata]|nr:hypothetical protein C8R43DRAFT_1120792 [Mycena crocata]